MKRHLLFLGFLFITLISNAQFPTFQWAKSFGGPYNEFAVSKVDGAGNVISIGSFHGIADFDPGESTFNLVSAGSFDDYSQSDIFVSKLDANGKFLWARSFGDTFYDGASDIAFDKYNNLYLTGAFRGTIDFNPGIGVFNLTSFGKDDMFILKLDSNGNFLWAKNIGGSKFDFGSSIAVDVFNKIIVTGYFRDTVDFDPGPGAMWLTSTPQVYYDIFILCIDKDGEFIWVKQVKNRSYNYGVSLALDVFGNIYTTGTFRETLDFSLDSTIFQLTSTTDQEYRYTLDAFVAKFDNQGNLLWAKQFGGMDEDYCRSVSLDKNGNVYTTGWFNGSADFDPGHQEFYLTSSNLNIGYEDMFISKLDFNGNFLWARQIGGYDTEGGTSIAVDEIGNVYTTGYFNGSVDFDPSMANYFLTGIYGEGIFISKLDANGHFVWVRSVGGDTISGGIGLSITTDVSGNIFTTGVYWGRGDFDCGPNVFNLESLNNDNYDIFILKMSLYLGANENEILVYPNPNNGQFRVCVVNNLKEINIEIYNSIGSLIFIIDSQKETTPIDLSDQASGLYFVKVIQDNKVLAAQKVVKL